MACFVAAVLEDSASLLDVPMVDAPPALMGDELLARDRTGEWLAAEVVSERGEANEREVFVAFSGSDYAMNVRIATKANHLGSVDF